MKYFVNRKKTAIGLILYGLMSVSFFGNVSYASEDVTEKEFVPVVNVSSFTLPDDLTKWKEVTSDFLDPVLTSEKLKSLWDQLSDLTMPSTGNFDPIDKERREKTIRMSYIALVNFKENEGRETYLEKLLERHKGYLKK